MVSEANRVGLYIAIPIYFLILVSCAYWAKKKMEKMAHDEVSDNISAHYLGGRLFGPVLTAGTLFASLFSGYTVTGVPNESYNSGWNALRWLSTDAYVAAGLVGCGVRLRKASMVRNHQSPADFITDRFQSQLLRYTVVVWQVVPTVIYLAAQVNALKNEFNAMFGLGPEDAWPAVIIVLIILMFEWAGGLSSVALTDSIQGFVMLLSFIILPLIIKKNFGGWVELDPETYPRPEFYATPTKEQQWGFWQFSIINVSMFTLPQFIQRNYAASSLSSLRYGWTVVTLGPWVTMIPGVFLGTMGVQMLANQSKKPGSPFSAILDTIMDLGGFPRFMGIIAFTAGLAAIMSTADSCIIAISQLITSEVIYPLRPNTKPKEIVWIGRGISLISTAIALAIGLAWKAGITALGAIQFPLSMQCVPAFLIGLFSTDRMDVHPWSISVSANIAAIYVFCIYFDYIKKNESAKAIDAGVTGAVFQIGMICLFEIIRRSGFVPGKALSAEKDKQSNTDEAALLIYPNRPEWDKPHLTRFGEHTLTPKLLNKMMMGIDEPFKQLWYAILIFFAISMTTPLVPEKQPAIVDGMFAYAPATLRGIPWWATKIILLNLVPYGVVLISLFYLPGSFPMNEKKIEAEGIDPDLIELTPKEMGSRTSYDAPNDLLLSRRSTIRQSMSELGMTIKSVSTLDSVNTSARRRLSSLVLGKEKLEPVDES